MDHNSTRSQKDNNTSTWNPFLRSIMTRETQNLCSPKTVTNKPPYLRLDSAGESTSEEDIPIVIASRSSMGRRATNQSILGPVPNSGNQTGWQGLHQKPATHSYCDSTPSRHFQNVPMNRNCSGYNRPPVVTQPYLGYGAQYLTPQDQGRYPSYCATPFQFGTGMGYDFIPPLYPWNMYPTSFQPSMPSYNIPQQMFNRTSAHPCSMPSQTPRMGKKYHQNFNTQRQQHKKRPQYWKTQVQQCDNRANVPQSNMSCGQSPDLKSVTRAVAITENMECNSENAGADLPSGDSIGCVTKEIQELRVKSGSAASEPCLLEDKSDSAGSGLDYVDGHDNSGQIGNLSIDPNSIKPQSEVTMKENKRFETSTEPMTKKYATISVKKFFSNAKEQVLGTDADNPNITCDKTVKDSPVSETSVKPSIEQLHTQGLQSELDLIKDAYLPSDKCECGKDGSSSDEAASATVNGTQKNNIKSFTIKAFVSSNNFVDRDRAVLTDSFAGVHSASPNVEDSSEPCQFNAHIILTPKTNCLGGYRRKKTRPSSKKRQRKKAQRSDNQALPDTCEANKKQKTGEAQDVRSPAINVPKTKKFSFYVDVSDGADDSQPSSPLKSSPELKNSPQSPCFSKFSFVIQSSEFSSDSDDDSESDDDGFDESDDENDLWNSFNNFNIHCSFSPLSCDIPAYAEESSPPTSPGSSAPDSPDPSNEDLLRSVKEANQKWNSLYASPDQNQAATPKKVLFADNTNLATIHVEEEDLCEEYQAARKGPWEEYARDRCRFKSRISYFETLIEPFLQSDHRDSVYNKYHC